MMTPSGSRSPVEAATTARTAPRAPIGAPELFTPKLVTVLREGYGGRELRADILAGLTVAIVALPLSMAIAIASGVSPDRGLYTAIVGGFLVSMLGGSRHQIGGPAGAFIVLVAATVERHGLDGLMLATMLSGLFLGAMGLLRFGAYIKFIPYPVTVGFTAGIAAIIFASQLAPLLGLTLGGPEPGPFLEKLPVLWAARGTVNPAAVAIALGVIAAIVAIRRHAPRWPGMLIAVAAAALATALFDLPVETIASRFGELPRTPPLPSLPPVSLEKVVAVLPDALAFTLLGAIESLLSAVVADSMTGRRHRSNCELLAQGTANVFSGLFGGFCVTGTIARTATNVRAGAHGPVAGMAHAGFLFLFLLVAAPLAGHIPLAALAGVLATVAWNMAERHAFANLLTGSRGDAVALLATFLLTLFRDLTEAIVVGLAIGSLIFIHRMSEITAVTTQAPFVPAERADEPGRPPDFAEEMASDPDVAIHRITGALFFGAASILDGALDSIADSHKALIVDISAVPFLDSSGAHSIEGLAKKAGRRGVRVFVAGADPQARRALLAQGVRPPLVGYAATVGDALAQWRETRGAS